MKIKSNNYFTRYFRFKPIIVLILIFECIEQLCLYSVLANFVRFCTIYLDVSNVTALKLIFIFTGAIYILCVFGGWMADSVLGKYRMIIISGFVYFIGVFLITIVTFEFKYYFENMYLNTLEKRIFSGIGLVLIAFGTGGIKTVVGPFGAQQLSQGNQNLTKLYFIWFYWFVNTGASVAFTVVAYVEQYVSFFYGFLIPLTSIVIAMIIFLVPSRYYLHEDNIENTVKSYAGIFLESVKRSRKSDRKYDSLFDYATLSNGGSYDQTTIDGLKQIKKIIPILITFIPFYIAYLQMQSSYLVQSERFNLKVNNFEIPIASLNVVNTFVIIFIIPIMAGIVYPLIRYCCGFDPRPLQRIGFGLFLGGVSVLLAGIVEIIRKNDLLRTGGIPQKVFKNTYNVTEISVLVQIPQFFFVGAGEVFAATTGLEFAYSQAPKNLRSLISGVFYLMIGISSFLGSALIELVNVNSKNQWVPNNIDDGHYEYFYFFLFGLLMLDVIIFSFIATKYKYVNFDDPDDINNEKEALIVSYRSSGEFNNSISIERRPILYTASHSYKK